MQQPERVFDFVAIQQRDYPKADALCMKVKGEWKKYSTQDIAQISRKLAAGLLAMGLRPGDKIAIISENRPEWVFADLAIQQIGAVSVPMYPNIAIKDYEYIFRHAEATVAFVANLDCFQKVSEATQALAMKGIFAFEQLEGVPFWEEVFTLADTPVYEELDKVSALVTPDQLLTLIYTSGTTGNPKGVMLTHRNVVANVLALTDRTQYPKGEFRAVSFLPMSHIFERTGIFFYLYIGASVYFAESLEKIGDNIREVKPHVFNTVPRLLEKIYDKIVAKGNELTGLKKKLFFGALNHGLQYEPHRNQGWWYNKKLAFYQKLIFSKWQEALGGQVVAVCSGGAALQPRLARIFWAAGIKVGEAYGLTETSPGITVSYLDAPRFRVGCTGAPLQGVEVKIAEDGEILCKGENVMQGYYKEPQLTAQVLKEGWFHTGDIGEMVEGKFLKITDRKKEMFKTSGGKYVAPQILENALKESYLIEQAMVVGENQKFPGVLLVPNFEALAGWYAQQGKTAPDPIQMVADPEVHQLIDEEIKTINQRFGNWERVKKFVLLPTLWTVETGEMTPKMSLKRRVISEKFAPQIVSIYQQEVSV
jgi:long-chain acyl-CoA synthetase